MNRIYIFIGTIIICIIYAICLFVIIIPYLHKLKFGQSIRLEGPRNHQIKAGTPTMAGIGIISGGIIIFSFLLAMNLKGLNDDTIFDYKEVILLLLPFIGYGLIGFWDDYLIIKKRNNQGLKSKIKFLLQMILAVIYYFIYLELGYNNTLNFFGISIDLAFGYGILIILLFTSTTNATNITDGIDGLLGGTSFIAYTCFFVLASYQQEYLVMSFCLAMMIVLWSYLLFNLPKAKVFMGDCGSLAIGGGLVSVAIFLKMELLLLIIGFVFVLETVTVILQVWFFKKTKGQRLFRMTPFHHHLELSGYNEWEIDFLLWVIGLTFGLVGILLGKVLFIK